MPSLLFDLLENPDFVEGVYWQRQRIEANKVIVHEGERGRQVYLILSGQVRVVGSVDLDEHARIRPGFSELSAGDLFGELAAFDDEPRSATVVAVSDVELAVIDGEALLRFLDAHTELGYAITRELISTLVVRLRKANQRVFSLFSWGLKSHGIDDHLK